MATDGRRLDAPVALVMGDVDLVRALGLAGIRCAFFGLPDASARFSRHVACVLPCDRPIGATRRSWCRRCCVRAVQPEAPVLYPQTDAALLLASRHRDELGNAFRLMLADAELIEQLVDKGRFQALPSARTCRSPPPSACIRGRGRPRLRSGLRIPAHREAGRARVAAGNRCGAGGKAMHVGGPDEWAELWPRARRRAHGGRRAAADPGPESAIESYHAYVDDDGAIAGEFTGRKIRTYPPQLRLQHCGRDHRRARRGGARPRRAAHGSGCAASPRSTSSATSGGRLHLLEVNPRFNLWHHPAAVAGVNLPALVHADLTGRAAAAGPARRAPRSRGACRSPICAPRVRLGLSPLTWLRWAGAAEREVRACSRDDPLPFVRGTLWLGTSARARLASPARARAPLMRFGVIADMHANLHALEAALAFLSDQGVDAYLCAGDLVGYGPPFPNECVRRGARPARADASPATTT